MKDLILVGIQGSGKGTQAKMLVEQYGYHVIATGDYFRSLKDNPSLLAQKITETINRGDYIDDVTVMEIVEEMVEGVDKTKPLLFDGVPRSEVQRVRLEEMLAARGRAFIVLMLDIPEEVAIERLLKRAEIEGRADDTEEGIRSRLGEYYAHTKPMITSWQERGVVSVIDGMQSPREVSASIHKILA